MRRVLVTGATGFVGRTLCPALSQSGCLVRAALRTDGALPAGVAERAVVGEIASATDWNHALAGVDAVVHVAARAHVLRDERASQDLYLETNARGTLRLAEAAARCGVRRLVYLSTVKVHGEATLGRAIAAGDEPCPQDEYAVSKWLGEKHLTEVAALTGMEAVIVRAPLVYGPEVRANFLRLMQWVDRELPLPLGAIANTRSLVSTWNLCDLLIQALRVPAAAGRAWMVSDGENLSTPELIRRIGGAMGRRVRLLPVPPPLLRSVAGLLGRSAEIARLCGSLTVDLSQTLNELGWSPPVTVDEALQRTVDWYLAEAR